MAIKHRYPFAEEDTGTQTWAKCPKVDTSLSRIANKSDLSFEDSGTLKDPMVKKAESLLKRAWEAGASHLNPVIACTARTLLLWLNQLQELLEGDTPREQLLITMPTLTRAAAFVADASAEAVKTTARQW